MSMKRVKHFVFRTLLFPLFLIVVVVTSSAQMSVDSSTIPASKDVSLLFAGDMLLAKGIEKCMESFGLYYPFEDLDPEFRKHDIVCVNLETSITGRGGAMEDKLYTFRLSPLYADFLDLIKIDVYTLANNHLLDFGVEGLIDTIHTLDSKNILHCGAGSDLNEARTGRFIFKESSLFTFLAYSERPPKEFYAEKDKPGTAPLRLNIIKSDIKRVKRKNSVIFVSLHWGIERTSTPSPEQVRIAHKIIDYGADAVIGHHPHVPQSVEMYKGKPIFYSLGNCISGYMNSEYKSNIMANLVYNGGKLKKIRIIPIAGEGSDIFKPYILKGNESIESLQYLKKISDGFKTDMTIHSDEAFVAF